AHSSFSRVQSVDLVLVVLPLGQVDPFIWIFTHSSSSSASCSLRKKGRRLGISHLGVRFMILKGVTGLAVHLSQPQSFLGKESFLFLGAPSFTSCLEEFLFHFAFTFLRMS